MSSLWALPCPLPGVSDPLGGADALPFPSSPGGVTVADLVNPKITETTRRIVWTWALFVQGGAGGMSKVCFRSPVAAGDPWVNLLLLLQATLSGEAHYSTSPFPCPYHSLWLPNAPCPDTGLSRFHRPVPLPTPLPPGAMTAPGPSPGPFIAPLPTVLLTPRPLN